MENIYIVKQLNVWQDALQADFHLGLSPRASPSADAMMVMALRLALGLQAYPSAFLSSNQYS